MNQVRPKRMKVSLRVVETAILVLALLGGASLASAQIYSDIFNFNGGNGASPSDPQVMAQGQDGNLYGTVPSGVGNSGVVFKFTPAGAYTVLHAFSGPPLDGLEPNAGLTLGLDGNFYGSTVLGGTSDLAPFSG